MKTALISDTLITPKSYARILCKRHVDPGFILSQITREYGPDHGITRQFIIQNFPDYAPVKCNVVHLPAKTKPALIKPSLEFPKTWRDVVNLVAYNHHVTFEDIIGPSRHEMHFKPRRMVCYILRERGHTLNQIGRWLGGRDHSSIFKACRRFVELASRNDVLAARNLVDNASHKA